MNSNFIDSFETAKENHVLQYMYLSNNMISVIPLDIVNFKKLKHLSLDVNKISDINPQIFNGS